jgi:hypothetical protein
VLADLQGGHYSATAPRWRDLSIGDQVYSFSALDLHRDFNL